MLTRDVIKVNVNFEIARDRDKERRVCCRSLESKGEDVAIFI